MTSRKERIRTMRDELSGKLSLKNSFLIIGRGDGYNHKIFHVDSKRVDNEKKLALLKYMLNNSRLVISHT